jgi:hypothetical protein
MTLGNMRANGVRSLDVSGCSVAFKDAPRARNATTGRS